MNVASLDRCKELYELSGWDSDELNHNAWYDDKSVVNNAVSVPRYPLGYLLRKLPQESKIIKGHFQFAEMTEKHEVRYHAFYDHKELEKKTQYYTESADTPEDAACKLAIELFKQGVLANERKD